MDNVVYLDFKAKEFEKLKNGQKSMIIRGAMGRKLPYGRVFKSDVLYFIENKGDGLVKGKAVVDSVIHSEKLTKEASKELVEKYQRHLYLNKILEKKYAGKRYLVLITIKDFEEIEPFKIDRTAYKNMDDWLPVENIENVREKRIETQTADRI